MDKIGVMEKCVWQTYGQFELFKNSVWQTYGQFKLFENSVWQTYGCGDINLQNYQSDVWQTYGILIYFVPTLNSWHCQLPQGFGDSFPLCPFFYLSIKNYHLSQNRRIMEVKIRGLDQGIIVRIDDLAKGQGKSRNEYLKEQLKHLAYTPELKETEDKYQQLVQQLLIVIKQNTELINEIIGESDE